MWVIRAYAAGTEEEVFQHDLAETTVRELVRLLSLVPTIYGVTPLDGGRLIRVIEAFHLPIIKDAQYFLEFDADREPEHPVEDVRATAEAVAALSR